MIRYAPSVAATRSGDPRGGAPSTASALKAPDRSLALPEHAAPNYVCVLNWVTLPLEPGVSNVSVEALVNGQWSGFCGNVCGLTIVDPRPSLVAT